MKQNALIFPVKVTGFYDQDQVPYGSDTLQKENQKYTLFVTQDVQINHCLSVQD